MSRYFNKKLTALKQYVPGEQPPKNRYIKLNTNENPFPPSPTVIAAVKSAAENDMNIYPDTESSKLCSVLVEMMNSTYQMKTPLTSDMLVIGNGSDELIAFAFEAFGGDGMVYNDITYGFYKVFAQLYGVESTVVPLNSKYCVPVDEMCKNKCSVIIANPNAPTGIALSLDEVRRIVEANPDYAVIVDEAYVDFGGKSAISLISDYNNLLVIQTFSKSRALAGSRLGFAVGSPELISDMKRIRFSFNPYSVNCITEAAGYAAVKNMEYFNYTSKEIINTRNYFTEGLRKLGFEVLDSSANFVFARYPKKDGQYIDGGLLYRMLKQHGILVRHFDEERLSDFLRISIGFRQDMSTVIIKLKDILREIQV